MARERCVVRTLRIVTVAVFVAALAAGVLGTAAARTFAIVLVVPGGWTCWRPRWPQITVWAMWATAVGMLAAILSIDQRMFGFAGGMLLGVACALIIVVLPLVRRTALVPPLRGESRLPSARIVR
jgi:hypothetical protein